MLTYDGDAAYDGSLQNYMYTSDTNVSFYSLNRKCFYLNNKEIQWKSRGNTILEIHVQVTIQPVSKGEQGIIHMVSGLGFVWALAHILKSGVAQAASRIQAAFRAHSFKKRKQKVAAERDGADEYGILPSEIEALSAVSKLTFGNARHHNTALAIQKKYRGWKGRKDYLTLRKKVVKIQAHVRGHQARKNYEAICWAVGIAEKIILRWHRKRVGLRGFHLDSIDEKFRIKDIAKRLFRICKSIDVALAEAVLRVLFMVNSTPARQQYIRMLQKYQQAKAEQGESCGSAMFAPKSCKNTAWVKGSKEIAGLMLMTMEPEIQRNLENLHAKGVKSSVCPASRTGASTDYA
ncbi:ankyrin repeat-containing protein [Tanacetum coccineum]